MENFSLEDYVNELIRLGSESKDKDNDTHIVYLKRQMRSKFSKKDLIAVGVQ